MTMAMDNDNPAAMDARNSNGNGGTPTASATQSMQGSSNNVSHYASIDLSALAAMMHQH